MPEAGHHRPHRARIARARRPRPNPTLVLLCVAVTLPIVASVAMALHNGWTPVGDNAILALRAGDLVRGDPPLVGIPTAIDTITPTATLANPGPIEVWVAALPTWALGPTGLLLTVATVNALALILAVQVGWRRGRTPLAVAVAATSLALCWSLGTAVIHDPLHTHVGLIPWFAIALLALDVRLGRWRSLPVLVALLSWVAQAHVLWLPKAGFVVAGTGLLMAIDHRRRTAKERVRFRRGRRLALIWATTWAVVLQLPLLIDQLSGSANLGRTVGFADEPGRGLAAAARTTVVALGFAPGWLRQASDPLVLLRGPRLIDIAAFAATIGLGAWTWTAAARRRDRVALALHHVALLFVLGSVVTLARIPLGGAVVAAEAMLVLRPVTAVVWLSIGWSGWRMAAPRLIPLLAKPQVSRPAVAVASVAALSLVALTVFTPPRFSGPGEALMEPIARVEPDVLEAMDGQALVQVNASGWAARRYLRPTLLDRLERAGISVRTGEDDPASRRGPQQGEPTATVWIVTDPVEPSTPAPGAVLIARTDLVPGGGLSGASQRRRQLRQVIADAGTVALRSSDQISAGDLSREYFHWTTPPPQGIGGVPAEWVSVDAFVDLARNDLIASPTVAPGLIDRMHDDAIGRRFAEDDMELAIYIRYET